MTDTAAVPERAAIDGTPIASRHESAGAPFLPLLSVFGDGEVAAAFSDRARVESWLLVERKLAAAQAKLGEIPAEAGSVIELEATIDKVDFNRLYTDTRRVGYPILPLLEQVTEQSPEIVGAYLHWGTTTQDIMDTGLVLQVERGLRRIDVLQRSVAHALAASADEHRSVPIAARTHAQQAVPTTFGSKVAVWLEEFCRHIERLAACRERVVVVQLFGAGGTAAALGPASRSVRRELAAALGIRNTDVPWHTARDNLCELGLVLASIAATSGRIAREIIELSRTEIAELRESAVPGHGASSTMPQKANPVLSEAIVGMSALARSAATSVLAAMQAEHERSAGEWQIEWDALPSLFALAGGCLKNLREVLASLVIFPDRMRANLDGDGGMIMSEATMIALARIMGRARSHALVSEACRDARDNHRRVADALRDLLLKEVTNPAEAINVVDVDPTDYLGEAEMIVDAAIEHWRRLEDVAAKVEQNRRGATPAGEPIR